LLADVVALMNLDLETVLLSTYVFTAVIFAVHVFRQKPSARNRLWLDIVVIVFWPLFVLLIFPVGIYLFIEALRERRGKTVH
jgi:hypothetical protein